MYTFVPVEERIEDLPTTFSYRQARDLGISKRQVYRWRDDGVIELLGPGLYHRVDAPIADPDLIEIAHRAPMGTLCLTSALVHHGLSDAIPAYHDVAIPRGQRPHVVSAPVRWHRFATETFEVDREFTTVDEDTCLGVYGPTRTIVDVFRLSMIVGSDVAHEALRRWVRKGGQPAELLRTATHFPRTLSRLRSALEILL
jgi:predicted transcriptional regulator of viral defense system